MLTLKVLIAATPGPVRRRSGRAAISIWKAELGQDSSRRKYKQVWAKASTGSGIPRLCQFRFYDEHSQFGEKNPTWVHCNCQYFTFYLEAILSEDGSSSIIDSDGSPPSFMNPQGNTYLCKHLFAAVQPALMSTAQAGVAKRWLSKLRQFLAPK